MLQNFCSINTLIPHINLYFSDRSAINTLQTEYFDVGLFISMLNLAIDCTYRFHRFSYNTKNITDCFMTSGCKSLLL